MESISQKACTKWSNLSRGTSELDDVIFNFWSEFMQCPLYTPYKWRIYFTKFGDIRLQTQSDFFGFCSISITKEDLDRIIEYVPNHELKYIDNI